MHALPFYLGVSEIRGTLLGLRVYFGFGVLDIKESFVAIVGVPYSRKLPCCQ